MCAERKTDPSGKGKEIVAELSSHDLLDQDTHLLVEIKEVIIASVKDGGRTEGGHVDLLEPPDKLLESGVDITLVTQKNTVIFPGKGIPEIIFKKA